MVSFDMKKLAVLVLLFGVGLITFNYLKGSQPEKKSSFLVKEDKKEEKAIDKGFNVTETRSIFVPDWTLDENYIFDDFYDRFIYFGENQNRPENFSWMTYKVNTAEELKELNVQNESVEGIVLDLEINGIPTEELITKINAGVERVYNQAKQRDIKVALALYGDLFYRQRPYDLKTLSLFSDEIMVMAYDFHKSYGEPGPNFPYEEFEKMIDQYLDFVPAEKLTVIFGMYGYDWALKDGKPLKTAEALTLNEIESEYSYEITSDPVSKEKRVNYKGEDGYDHLIFFEDEESVGVKIEYLREKEIGSIAFWAWGYF